MWINRWVCFHHMRMLNYSTMFKCLCKKRLIACVMVDIGTEETAHSMCDG